ncbi:MAG: septum formation initiator family protein [Lachnospiraceae bacterium]|nr:septum formation initiator family protein [Lachnospiraceae bacterium]
MRSNRQPVSRETRRGMILIIVVVGITILALAIRCRSLADKNDTYAQQIESLEQKITDEQDRGESIETFRGYTHTNAYIEKVAREKLGLVYPDEVIFQPAQ